MLQFRRPTTTPPSRLTDSSKPLSISPLISPQQQHARKMRTMPKMIDRFQILALTKPHIARMLISWVDLFLDKHGV